MEQKLVDIIRNLGIPELQSIKSLNVLDGSYLNLECKLPNGNFAKILDDGQQYLACQVDENDSDRCYGVAANSDFVAVYKYGCNGADAELVLWKKI